VRRLVILGSCLAVTLAVAQSTPAQSQTSEAPDQVSRDVTGNIGPDGQKPIGGVTAEDVRMLAESVSISQEDARFVFHEGGGALIEFKKRHQDSQLFGGVRFRYKPTFEVQLRTTALSKELQDDFKASVGRPYRVLVGGLSEKQLYAKQMRLSEKLLRKKSKDGTNLTFRFETDFEKGDVSLLLQPDDLLSADLTDIRSEVNLAADPDSKIGTASYAGAPTASCTIGYAVSRPIGPGVRQGALVTAGHCPDTGQVTYGFSLGNVQDEVCGGQDRQLHTTPTNFLWNGFFLPGGSWTQIQAVAGGWYDGQPFARERKFTSAQGTIRTPGPVAPQVSGGDCGNYSVYGFILDNYPAYASQKAIGGDSGGPLLLAYNGNWYLAGTTSGQGVVGGISDGLSAWRDVPWPWTPCTLTTPCGTLF
jgi:hypothetical protein